MGLTEFLGDDLGGGIRVQEEVTQDLANDLVGAAVIGFWAGLLGQEGREAALVEMIQELVIALAAEAVTRRDGGDVVMEALALQEHEEAVRLLVSERDRQGAGGAGELMRIRIELETCIHGENIEREGGNV